MGRKGKDRKIDISVCIATFRRPQGLVRLLESLERLSGLDDLSVEVIVVDNDRAGTARAVVEQIWRRFKGLRYYVEPRQNIAHARNCGVREARGTWIAFIDDDEVASKNWLGAYWRMAAEGAADGYFGPVLPRFEHPGPTWLDKDIFFARPRYRTGTRLSHLGQMRTTNAFIRGSLFCEHKFDPRYGLTGGEDTDIFARMVDAGAAFYWCDEAKTFEYYPLERLCLRWLVQRAFRGGLTYTLIKRRCLPRWYQQVPGMIKAMAGLFVFTLLLPFEILSGRKYAARRLLRLGVQVGHIWGTFNLTYEEYKVADAEDLSPASVEG